MASIRYHAAWLPLLLTAALSPIAAQGDVILNPSFETPEGLNFYGPGQTIGAGWVVEGDATNLVLVESPPFLTPAGDQYLVLFTDANSTGIIRQDLTLATSAIYQLSFLLGDTASDGKVTTLAVDVLEGSQSLLAAPGIFIVGDGAGFLPFNLMFMSGESGATRVRLTAIGDIASVDGFGLQAVAVPEPAAAIALFAAVGFFKLRRVQGGRKWHPR